MAKIDKDMQTYVKSYFKKDREFYLVCMPDGNGLQIRKQGFIAKKDAIEFAKQKYQKMLADKGLSNSYNSKILFKAYTEEWILTKLKSGEIKESSAMRYRDIIDGYLNPFFGNLKISQIQKYHLINFIREMQQNDQSSFIQKMNVDLFKTIIKQAESDDLIGMNNIHSVKTPKHKPKKAMFWDQKQTTFFLNTVKSHPLHNLWKFALYTGMRASEISGLKWDCVLFDHNRGGYTGYFLVKRIYNQKTRKVEETTKNGDARFIPMILDIKEMMLEMKKQSCGEFVFGNDKNLESSHFSRQLKSALCLTPTIPNITFHNLRHTFCSFLESTGMNRRTVSSIMGHRDMNTTNRYSHVNEEMIGEEVASWSSKQSNKIPTTLKIAREKVL